MNDKTLILLAAGGLGLLWFKNRAMGNPPASGGPSNGIVDIGPQQLIGPAQSLPILQMPPSALYPSLPQTVVNATNPAMVPSSINQQLQTPFFSGPNMNPSVESQMPAAPIPQPTQQSNVFILPWDTYRPDNIAPGTIHAYSWLSPDLSVNPVTFFRPYIGQLPDGYAGAQGFEVSISKTPGDFDTPIGKMSDPTGQGKLFYVGDRNAVSWVTPIESNTHYYFNIRPLPNNLGLAVWTN